MSEWSNLYSLILSFSFIIAFAFVVISLSSIIWISFLFVSSYGESFVSSDAAFNVHVLRSLCLDSLCCIYINIKNNTTLIKTKQTRKQDLQLFQMYIYIYGKKKWKFCKSYFFVLFLFYSVLKYLLHFVMN